SSPGSGKTTLLRCIAGLERPREGRFSLNGQTWQDSARGLFVPAHQRDVGYVFQHANLFPHLSVRRNLEYGWRRLPVEKRVSSLEQTAELLGLSHLLDRTPDHLSGGERQRVAIARALLVNSRLLLMDEPLTSLDLASKREIYPYLERLHAELSIPILYVSHDPHEIARIADRVVLMEQGKVIAVGEATDIFTRLDLTLARDEQALSIIETRIAEHNEADKLSTLEFSGGQLLAHRVNKPLGASSRIGIMARDVSLTLSRHTDSSILNIIPVRACEWADDGTGHVMVRLDAGGTPLLARISSRSVRTLGLQRNMELYAQVKG
ncbi:TPA: molybdenum ABC transporter ATP-binding protein, partial [Candidatus Sumerlaeota bacterium]|nr:molybdenum ABC transporter ATP-binding protein [Candidatus Sumerlaeota bacterium]